MQKGRILLSIFSLPIITLFLLSHLLTIPQKNSYNTNVLAAKSASIQSFEPTNTPSFLPTQTVTPTQLPTPSLKPKVIAVKTPTTPKPTKQPMQTSPTEFILQKVNEYRASLALSPVRSNSETCSFAQVRAEEISSSEKFNHNGFVDRINNKNLPYPNYSEVTENIAYNTDYTDVVTKWIASSGHAENMRKNTQYVCVGKFGDYYAYEGWQP